MWDCSPNRRDATACTTWHAKRYKWIKIRNGYLHWTNIGKPTCRRVKIDESFQAVGDVEVLEKNISVDDIVFDGKGNAGWHRMC